MQFVDICYSHCAFHHTQAHFATSTAHGAHLSADVDCSSRDCAPGRRSWSLYFRAPCRRSTVVGGAGGGGPICEQCPDSRALILYKVPFQLRTGTQRLFWRTFGRGVERLHTLRPEPMVQAAGSRFMRSVYLWMIRVSVKLFSSSRLSQFSRTRQIQQKRYKGFSTRRTTLASTGLSVPTPSDRFLPSSTRYRSGNYSPVTTRYPETQPSRVRGTPSIAFISETRDMSTSEPAEKSARTLNCPNSQQPTSSCSTSLQSRWITRAGSGKSIHSCRALMPS